MTKRKIIGAKSDSEGDITHVKLNGNTNYTSVERAIPIAERGDIENAHVVHAPNNPDKKTYLRTNPDNSKSNNLDDMAGDN